GAGAPVNSREVLAATRRVAQRSRLAPGIRRTKLFHPSLQALDRSKSGGLAWRYIATTAVLNSSTRARKRWSGGFGSPCGHRRTALARRLGRGSPCGRRRTALGSGSGAARRDTERSVTRGAQEAVSVRICGARRVSRVGWLPWRLFDSIETRRPRLNASRYYSML